VTLRAVCAAAAGVVVALAVHHLAGGGLAATVLAIASGGATYGGVLWCLRTPELTGVASVVRRPGTSRV